jgi:hypothetical protein
MGGATILLLNMNLGLGGSESLAGFSAVGLEFDGALVVGRPDFEAGLSLFHPHHDAATVIRRPDFEANE